MSKRGRKKRPPLCLKFFPVKGPIWYSAKSFSEKRGRKKLKHCAVDIFGKRYQAIILPCDMTITEYGYSRKGGHYVKGKDDSGYTHYFAHLDCLIFEPTNEDLHRVKYDYSYPAGTIIGFMGNSGNAAPRRNKKGKNVGGTRCHLHHQCKFKKSYVNHTAQLDECFRRENRKKRRMKCEKNAKECQWCRRESDKTVPLPGASSGKEG